MSLAEATKMGQERAREISKEYAEHIKHERFDGTCDVSECRFKDGRRFVPLSLR